MKAIVASADYLPRRDMKAKFGNSMDGERDTTLQSSTITCVTIPANWPSEQSTMAIASDLDPFRAKTL
jgi:hypothetical protein